MKQLYQDRQYTKYIEDLIEKNEIPWDTDTLVDMFTYMINKSILQETLEKRNHERTKPKRRRNIRVQR